MNNFTNYFDIFNHHAEVRGNKTAMYYEEKEITYGELNDNINRFANILKKLGIKAKDRVIITLPDCPDYVYAIFGAMKYGAIPVLSRPDLSLERYEFIFNDCTPSVLITSNISQAGKSGAPSLKVILSVEEELYKNLFSEASKNFDGHIYDENEIAFMLYTSGSTGNPKGVPHRHGDMIFMSETYGRYILNISEEDKCFSSCKICFAAGFGPNIFLPFYYGASTLLFPDKFTPSNVLSLISRYEPTFFLAPPTLYNLLLKTADKTASFNSLRICVSCGELLPAGINHKWKELTGQELLDNFGSTELMSIVISNGLVVPGFKAKLVNDEGISVPEGTEGYIIIKGNSSAPFYWNLPEKTKEMMLPDGWLKTGDIFIEENGRYIYKGRGDDMFKSGANWVSPVEVENVILTHPSVFECGVTWRKMEGLTKPIAFVILNQGFCGDFELIKDIRNHVINLLPDYMCPVNVMFIEEMPRTESGKIQRFKLREIFEESFN